MPYLAPKCDDHSTVGVQMDDLLTRTYSLGWWIDTVITPAMLMAIGAALTTISASRRKRRLLDLYILSHSAFLLLLATWFAWTAPAGWLQFYIPGAPPDRWLEFGYFATVIPSLLLLQLGIMKSWFAKLFAIVAYDVGLVAGVLAVLPLNPTPVRYAISYVALTLFVGYAYVWLASWFVVAGVGGGYRAFERLVFGGRAPA